MRIAVTTPTGHVGSTVTDFLLDRGGDIKVRLLGRRSQHPGRVPRPRRGNRHRLSGRHGLPDQGHAGCDALFWVTPPGYGSDNVRAFQNRLGKAAATAIEQQPHIAGGQPLVDRRRSGRGRRADRRSAQRRRPPGRGRRKHHSRPARLLLREPADADRLDPAVRQALIANLRVAKLSDDRRPRHRHGRRRNC